ncbi:MAG: DNA replication/repair protein RecF [Erysipelotrichales bacterium]|nr:DNA replication/repair protein RecF [Erysipelotrichales bacterium]
MKINHLELKNFRNYEYCFVEFDPFINIFIGKNAQGKTNLLEAIYILSLSKSFKTNIIEEFILFENEFSKLKGNITTNNKDMNLEIVLSTLGKKAIINHKEIKKSSDYVGYLNVVLFIPEDLMLIKGSPRLRRKLIDMEISKISPIYMYNLNKYNHLLKERNKYLKMLHDKHQKADDYLEVLTEQMTSLQVDLIKKRIEFVELLNSITTSMYDYISLHKEKLSIEYKSMYKSIDYETIYSKYQKNYQRDITYCQTMDGLHKDDMVMFLDGKNANVFASQGQQRSIVLAIKIALLELIKKEIGEYPILLLDDVLSELDSTRQTKLLNLIQGKVQTFLTSTSIEGIQHQVINQAKKIYIENGQVKGENNGRK